MVKRKNTHPQRPDREGHVTAMSAYPGPSVISILITVLSLHMIKQYIINKLDYFNSGGPAHSEVISISVPVNLTC